MRGEKFTHRLLQLVRGAAQLNVLIGRPIAPGHKAPAEPLCPPTCQIVRQFLTSFCYTENFQEVVISHNIVQSCPLDDLFCCFCFLFLGGRGALRLWKT